MLAIIDWGIGGVSIYMLIKERIGDVSVVYLSDTGATPYGKMTRPELVARLNSVIAFLRSRGVTHLVIGCNAASTAIEHLDTQGLKIIGMIESGVSAAMKQKPTRLGVIGGRRTVLSGVYRKAFAERGLHIEQRIAQPLSGLIENGDTSSTKLRNKCQRILSPIRNCSHILLACTHYPAIIPAMKQFVSQNTLLIDPALELTDKVSKWKLSGRSGSIFLTTGDPAKMKHAARTAFDVKIESITKIKI
jgi:glutamate racemase